MAFQEWPSAGYRLCGVNMGRPVYTLVGLLSNLVATPVSRLRFNSVPPSDWLALAG